MIIPDMLGEQKSVNVICAEVFVLKIMEKNKQDNYFLKYNREDQIEMK